jgi:BON domain-containing protein
MFSKKKTVGAAVGTKVASKAAQGVGKAGLKGGARAVTPKEPATSRLLKYGFFTLVGFGIGALFARSAKRGDVAPSFTGATVGEASDPGRPQRPEDPNRTGAEREYSDPSSGPLIGRQHQPGMVDIPEQQEEVQNRIRTNVGEDSRTSDIAHLNVEVNDGVADIRGEVHSEEEKQAVEEIASSSEGVTEVRNLLTVNPQAPSRGDNAHGEQDLPERPT